MKCFEKVQAIIVDDNINITSTKGNFQRHWQSCNKRKASSFSELHSGHYIAATTSDYLSRVYAASTQITMLSGLSYEMQQYGLALILEKKMGYIIIEKL